MQDTTRGSPATIVAILAAGTFCIMTMLGLMAALLVDLSREFSTSVATAGQLVTIGASTWGLLAPLIGPLSDRFGHKRMVVSGLAVSAVAMLGYTAGGSFPALVALSVLAGAGGAATGPNVLASVGDYFSADSPGRRMSLVNLGMPLASLAGVPLGALIAGSLGWRTSFLAFGLFMATVALLGIFLLPPARRHQRAERTKYFSSFATVFRHKHLPPLLAGNILLQIAYWCVTTYLAAFLIQTYSLNTGQVAPFLLLTGLGQLAGTLVGGPLADNLNKAKLLASTQVLSGLIGLPLMLLAHNIWLSVLLGALFMGLFGGNRPAFLVLMVLISSTQRGTVMGVQAATNQLGRGFGAMVGGFMLTLGGYSYVGIVCIVISLLAAALFFYASPSAETPADVRETS